MKQNYFLIVVLSLMCSRHIITTLVTKYLLRTLLAFFDINLNAILRISSKST